LGAYILFVAASTSAVQWCSNCCFRKEDVNGIRRGREKEKKTVDHIFYIYIQVLNVASDRQANKTSKRAKELNVEWYMIK
jgi:hypothetical protein